MKTGDAMIAVQIKLLPQRPVLKIAEVEMPASQDEPPTEKVRKFEVKRKYCDHGFVPDYCARCKFGELIHC